ncbi:hypothetical protein CPB83DRAFT_895957 [Crepidotus variabilis]|uniref:NACHT domain-containing protein n=1 Tax=Crepidotus variabilis TaxID=179855 RepID=A0A9P6ECS6_9AGAR|nr:hypothetical protein CPB83DRAFT_895957 [Crepidotus variabilis]
MQKISVFDNSSNIAISNSHISVAVNQSTDSGAALRFLYEATAKYAGSGHQDPSVCLEGTRTTALDEIDEWKRRSRQEHGSALMWVTGSAGSGKTAIAQTVYERFKAEGLLAVEASFFLSTGRTDPKYLFLAIAYQLAMANELLKASIETVLQIDPAVVDAPIEVQLQRLVLGSISKAGVLVPTIYVIIDGLDECGSEDEQIQIIHLIQGVIAKQQLPIRFLIASRPESWIQTTLSSSSAPHLSTVMLDQDKEADNDIRLFYKTEFKKIRGDPRHVHSMASAPSPWPLEYELDLLVRWASAQFIYAKTVTRFVGEPGHSPRRRLDHVLQPLPELTKSEYPLDRLDILYSHILSCVADWNLTSIVLGSLSVYTPLKVPVKREVLSIIEVIHGLHTGDAYLTLRNLHALVFVAPDLTSEREGTAYEDYRAILYDQGQFPRFYHKSFTDFLHHSQRAGEYFIDKNESNQKMAIGCLKVLQSVTLNPLTRLFSMTWYYAHTCWDSHCINSGSHGNQKLLGELYCFSFMSWYFLAQHDQKWKKLAALRRVERWKDDALYTIQEISRTLGGLGLYYCTLYYASRMWDWMKTQNDITLLHFPELRFKLCLLHTLADEKGLL